MISKMTPPHHPGMRRAHVLGLTLLLVLAGCSGVPFVDPPPQDEPAPVKMVNNATITETFTVAVVPEGDNLTVHRRDGQMHQMSVSPGSGTIYTETENKFIRIEWPESARHHGEYTLEPAEEKLIHVEPVAPDEAIVILIYDDPEESYRAIKSLSCGAAIKGFLVVTQAEGEDETATRHQCGGFSTWFDRTPPESPQAAPTQPMRLVASGPSTY